MSEKGDLQPDGERFLIMFPCFAVMDRDCKGGVVLPQQDGQTACVILTDEDLLRSFRQEYGFAGPTVRFEFEFQLFLYLRALPPSVTQVAFDPGKASVAIYPLDRLKAFLWEKVKEEYGDGE
jgi:hypothetical protein